MRRLRIWYDDDGTDGHGWIVGEFESERFKGSGMFPEHPSAMASFAERLGDYPLDLKAPPTFGGSHSQIALIPKGSVGLLELHLTLVDLFDRRQRLIIVENTSYSFAQRLQTAVQRLCERPDAVVEVTLD